MVIPIPLTPMTGEAESFARGVVVNNLSIGVFVPSILSLDEP